MSVNIHISLTAEGKGLSLTRPEPSIRLSVMTVTPTTRGRLDGLSILIVGGTSGLGLAATRACLREHASVTVVGRDDEDFAHAAAEFDAGNDVA